MEPTRSSDLIVLVLAPIGRDGPAAAELLRRSGMDATLCTGLDDLVARVEQGAAAIFVAEEALFGKDLGRLSRWIDAQHPWSDLPFVVLTSHHERPDVTAWRQRLVKMLRNVSLLERPVQPITLTSAVQAALRARERQYEVRHLLEDQEALVVARTQQLEDANDALRRQMAERARIEESLRHAQKMEAIGQLTGGVAHDFNNLLMVISGGLDMIDRQKEPSRRQRLILGMRQAAERGARLTKALLAFSRRQALQPEPVDLSLQLGGMRELLERSLRGDVRVELHFDADLWPVEVDPGELELVVLNLAVNARDAMPNGGRITIRAENECSQVGDLRRDLVRLVVIDTGTGMTEEVLQRAFDPFFTTKEVGKGSGLGLAQVYGFAKQSGGTASIASTPGQGTAVTLWLPRSGKPPERPDAVAPPGFRLEEQRRSVLLVEDDEEVAVLVSEMLGQLGYDVTRVESATAALGALANGRRMDVVFSDIMMPGQMDGLDLAREIRNRRPDLPVLLTSGYTGSSRQRAERYGITVLPKPYRLDELASALDEVIPTWKAAERSF